MKKTMLVGSKLRRQSDGKVFQVTELAHWSLVLASDGEKDSIKWLGGDEYVGTCDGYVLLP